MYGEGRSEGFLGTLARRIREGVEGSLRRLGTDRIDVWYQHYPDAEAPDDELVSTLDELVRSGKVLHLATSNVDGGQIAGQAAAARERGLATFAGVQSEWNLLSRAVEADVVPAARAEGMGVVPYFPLASGLLTGKYAAGQPYPDGSRFAVIPYFAQVATEDNFAAVARLSELAAARGHDLVSLAFGWLLAQPDVTSVIAGASTPAQVAANAGALGWTLDADDLAAVEAALAG